MKFMRRHGPANWVDSRRAARVVWLAKAATTAEPVGAHGGLGAVWGTHNFVFVFKSIFCLNSSLEHPHLNDRVHTTTRATDENLTTSTSNLMQKPSELCSPATSESVE